MPATVVPKAKRCAEVFDAFQASRREVTIKNPQAILESFEPPLDVVSFAPSDDDMLESHPKNSHVITHQR
jgi:hypothetical protein